MKIIQTVGTVQDYEIKVTLPEPLKDGEVDVIIIAKNELDEFEQRHQLMIEKGYDTPSKVMELIRQVKLEMLSEKGKA
ncbi:hypothetical protein [Crocosphaera watsonii]|uniref:Uncharacterized protein n=2 Tax=Crocosphaera watsonii TaxID=263511 RepID=G5JEX0_CROWT|nr:hypothetical protein [Crocosphaera watsonii]EHJ09267.1 hypothetical protein CWATWH0003_B307 [Crocosphaera watsonii WH 0003]MCH2232312.1 hypothetical protein [Crocinitomicaceae bacterium]CCQ58152.1 hypothetical protein CWATWH0005_4054 [Crocosphaera watsonii WH 0005]